MGIGSGTAMLIGGLVGAGTSVAGAAMSSNASENAAQDQSQAAEQAAQLQYQASQNALGFQENQWNTEQQELQPWLQSGQAGLSNLDYLLGVNPSSSSMPFQNGTGSYTGGYPPPGLNSASGTPGGNTVNPILSSSGPMHAYTGGYTPAAQYGTQSPNVAMGKPATIGSSPATGVNSPVASPVGPAMGTPRTIDGSQPGFVTNRNGVTAQPMASSGAVLSQHPGQIAAPTTGKAVSPTTTPSAAQPSAAGGFGSLLSAYPGQFQAPTAQQALNMPGEQAQLQLGEQALQQSAAARGNLLTGGTAEALNNFAQDIASTGYQNAYNNAYNTYAANYNQYENQQNNEFNRLAALSGVGQTAANQLGTLGQSASNNVSSNLLGTASSMGQAYQNAAAANASGMIGSANAWGGALGSTGNNLSQLAMLSALYGGGGGGSAANYLADSGYSG